MLKVIVLVILAGLALGLSFKVLTAKEVPIRNYHQVYEGGYTADRPLKDI